MQSVTLLRSLVARRVANCRNYADSHKFKVTTYNDLPSPQGSWQTQYDANQRKYNAQLVAGVAALIGSIVVARASGLLYFNYNYPDEPAPRE